MGLREAFRSWLNEEPVQTRSDSIDDLIGRMGLGRTRPWTPAGIKEAMGVPAIFGAVNLVANLVGSMSMKALRNEVELAPADRPRVIVRPDPFTIPREFYRSTAYNIASRGETWWWAAARDIDGMAISVLNCNPAEVTVEDNPDDPRYPIISWRNRVMPNADFLQLVYAREPGSLRGHGPLQMCGAAVSVAVEAQEWAANAYGEGGIPSILIKAAGALGPALDEDGLSEADRLRAQWIDRPNNVPRVIDEAIEKVEKFDPSPQTASMMDARQWQNVEVATMFGMPAPILNAAIAGMSLTYQNVGTEFEKLLRQCLRPNYLEVIEQTMSDLLPRSTVARFNTDALTLADIKTRYDVYGVGIDKGIIDAPEARRFEGLARGDVENAAVPYSPPAAFPLALPQLRSAAPVEVRCSGSVVRNHRMVQCRKFLGKFQPPYEVVCSRCKAVNRADPPVERPQERQLVPVPLLARTGEVIERPEAIVNPIDTLPERIAAAMPRSEPPVVNFHQGAIQTNVTVPEGKPIQPINMADVVKTIAMRVVFERDPQTNRITGFHEEPA